MKNHSVFMFLFAMIATMSLLGSCSHKETSPPPTAWDTTESAVDRPSANERVGWLSVDEPSWDRSPASVETTDPVVSSPTDSAMAPMAPTPPFVPGFLRSETTESRWPRGAVFWPTLIVGFVAGLLFGKYGLAEARREPTATA